MEEYSYISSSKQLKDASVLFASAHGYSSQTLFNNIKMTINNLFRNSNVDDDDEIGEMVNFAFKDIKNFIYNKVLYSPMSRTNTFAFSNTMINKDYLKNAYDTYNKLELKNISSLQLKKTFNNVRNYNRNTSNIIMIENHDKIINLFQNTYENIPIMYTIANLDEKNSNLFLNPKEPDYSFLKNKVKKNLIVNSDWIIRENNKAILEIPIVKSSHKNDKFMTWVKDQLSLNPLLSPNEYNVGDEKKINSTNFLKYYDFKSLSLSQKKKLKHIRYKIYTYIYYTTRYLSDRITEYFNWKQGHFMYDGILNEKTPDQGLNFFPNPGETNYEQFGLHRLLYVKDGKHYFNKKTNNLPKFSNQKYCSISSLKQNDIYKSIAKKPVYYEDIIAYINNYLYLDICNSIKNRETVPLSLIILQAWADDMDHLTIFSIACRKYSNYDKYQTNDALRRATSESKSQIINKIKPIKKSLQRALTQKLKFNKHKKQKSNFKGRKNKVTRKNNINKEQKSKKIKLHSVTKKCPTGSSINPKTNRCRKNCPANHVRHEKGYCVHHKKSKKLKLHSVTKKCPTGSSINPKTNRCRKNCPVNHVRHEKGYCVHHKKSKKIKLHSVTKKCPPGSSINPKTNRCRKNCPANHVRHEKGYCVKLATN